MSEHTPGPWSWEEVPLPGLGTNRWCEVLNGGHDEAVLRHESSGGPTPWRIDRANALLIAAAPDLLEAAWAVILHADAAVNPYSRLPKSVYVPLAAAIAKAEGR